MDGLEPSRNYVLDALIESSGTMLGLVATLEELGVPHDSPELERLRRAVRAVVRCTSEMREGKEWHPEQN